MNTNTNTNTHTLNRARGLLLVAPALLSIALLTGCAPEVGRANAPSQSAVPAPPSSTPTVDSSPSATPVEATPGQGPASEEAAIAGAEQAIADFLRIRGEVDASGGVETAPLETIATGTALNVGLGSARRVVEMGWKTEGALVFEPDTGYTTSAQALDGTNLPHGAAFITGCQENAGYKVFNADGSPATQPSQTRNEFEFTVLWNSVENKWLVNNLVASGNAC